MLLKTPTVGQVTMIWLLPCGVRHEAKRHHPAMSGFGYPRRRSKGEISGVVDPCNPVGVKAEMPSAEADVAVVVRPELSCRSYRTG